MKESDDEILKEYPNAELHDRVAEAYLGLCSPVGREDTMLGRQGVGKETGSFCQCCGASTAPYFPEYGEEPPKKNIYRVVGEVDENFFYGFNTIKIMDKDASVHFAVKWLDT